MAKRVGCPVMQGYGMTETSPVTHLVPPEQSEGRGGKIGLPLPDTEARIVDPETGEDAERGELWIRGPQVMKGYLNNAEATADTIDGDGWLHTGDIAEVDDDGLLRDRRPPEGADQVQGLPGASGRARGPAAYASHRSPTPP